MVGTVGMWNDGEKDNTNGWFTVVTGWERENVKASFCDYRALWVGMFVLFSMKAL